MRVLDIVFISNREEKQKRPVKKKTNNNSKAQFNIDYYIRIFIH